MLIGALVATACAGHREPTVADAPAAEDKAVPIFTASKRGESLRVPVVHSVFRGEPIRIALDTGAARTFVLGPFDRDHDASEPVGWATDAMGRRIAWSAADPRLMRPFARDYLPRALMVLHDAGLGTVGLDGALAPIDLLTNEIGVRMDFPAGRLDFVSAGALEGSSHGRICKSRPGADTGWHYVVDVDVADARVAMLLDTAWSHTALFSKTTPGHPGRRLDTVAAGGSGSLHVLGQARIEVGGATFEAARMASPRRAPGCALDGVLGFDVLSHCVVDLRRDSAGIQCDSRPPPVHHEPHRAP
jgi:hypothetical protein